MAEVYQKMEVSETKISTIENNEKPKVFLQGFSLSEKPNKLIISEENKTEIKEKLIINEEQIPEIEEKPIKLIIKEKNKPEIQEKPNKLIISEEKKPEIDLGLSLGGIYSENSGEKPISGSSSPVEIKKMNKEEDRDSTPPMPKSFLSLSRPCSVHIGAEHGQRKTAFIVVARRAFKPFVGGSSNNMGNRPANGVPQEKEKSPTVGPMPSSPSKVPAWAAASAARSPALCRALDQIRKHKALYGNRKFHGQGHVAEQKVAIRSQSLTTPMPTPKPAESKVRILMPMSTPKPGESKVRILMPTPKPAESSVTVPMPTPTKVRIIMPTPKPAESKITEPIPTPKPAESKITEPIPTPKPAESKITEPIPTPKPAESKVMMGSSSNGKAVKIEDTELQNPPKRIKLVNNGIQDNGMDVMKEMPSVTAVGNGPNGRKIEGFLYKYRKGQVRIVCICHGRFLSAADFVKHAGGTDVANPMKHITVSPTFSE